MLNGALMRIMYLLTWSEHALYPAPLLRLLSPDWGQGDSGSFTLQTLRENSPLLYSRTETGAGRQGAGR